MEATGGGSGGHQPGGEPVDDFPVQPGVVLAQKTTLVSRDGRDVAGTLNLDSAVVAERVKRVTSGGFENVKASSSVAGGRGVLGHVMIGSRRLLAARDAPRERLWGFVDEHEARPEPADHEG